MAASLTPQEAASAFRELTKGVRKAIRTPLNEAKKKARKKMKSDFLSKRPGRSIFGRGRKKHGKPPLIIRSRTRYSKSKESWLVTFILEGFAALIEEGGTTRPHPIRAGAKKLKFDARGGGGTVFTRSVRHPGGRVPRKQIGRKAVGEMFRALRPATDRSLQNAIRASRLA